jgi:hypothetical protein
MQVLDTKTMTWFVPKRQSNKQVKHMYNHSAVRAGPSSIFIFGGWDGRQALSDLYVVNIDSEDMNNGGGGGGGCGGGSSYQQQQL